VQLIPTGREPNRQQLKWYGSVSLTEERSEASLDHGSRKFAP
jgi:hypothetical protein